MAGSNGNGNRPDGERLQVVFLTGISYCGSTLVAFLLNHHPRILSVGEMGPSPRFHDRVIRCSCGEDVVSCPFWVGVADRMREQGEPFDTAHMQLRHAYSDVHLLNRLFSAHLGVDWLDALRDRVRDHLPGIQSRMDVFRRRNREFIRSALAITGKQVFLDGTKTPPRIPLLMQDEIDLRVIHLVRDPRGYCGSARKRSNVAARNAARDWVTGTSQIERYLSMLPESNWKRVQYEDICRDPEGMLSEVTCFMGAGAYHLPDNFRAGTHHILGNTMRHASDGRTRIQHDEKWREVLSEEDLEIIRQTLGPVASRLGYDL